MRILDNIGRREDFLQLDHEGQLQLCQEIRDFLVERVSDSGGHLASNLGIVEATVAIHRVFDTKKDKIVFDVGHQSYVHKILTGRARDFSTLRQLGGISGFPRPDESDHDAFVAGHASNSVSVALGLARARSGMKQDHSVVALIGDGALTGGLAYEGLNDAGESGEPLVIILNDNNMSIAQNVGGMSRHLALLRLKPGYFGLKKVYRRIVNAVPGGKYLYSFTHRVKSFLKRSLIGTTVFEEMGLTYLGPVDGHDIDRMTYLLQVAKEMACPVLLHIITQKGKGYAPAEASPQDYHGVGRFDPDVGLKNSGGKETFSSVFGAELTAMAAQDSRICAITAAMPTGTGLDGFAAAYPERFFDVGIAEGHAVSTAAGMAAGGLIPVFAVYSTFLQRGFDMLLHDVALMQNHVVFAVDRAGLVGEDGPTHHGVFDIGYLNQIPGLTVFSPATAEEVRLALRAAVYDCNGPAAIRYPRGYCCREDQLPQIEDEDPEVVLISYGRLAAEACIAATRLRESGIRCRVIRLMQLKPLDTAPMVELAADSRLTLILEETVSSGCIGQQIAEAAAARGISGRILLRNLGDSFTTHGRTEVLLSQQGLDGASICEYVQGALFHEK